MALYLTATGEYEQAETFYRKALAHEQVMPEILNNYGTFLCGQKRYAEGITLLEKAAKKAEFTQSAAAFENAGYCAQDRGDKALAISYLHKALLRDPVRRPSLYALSLLYLEQDNWQQAHKYAQRYQRVSDNKAKMQQLMQAITEKRQHQVATTDRMSLRLTNDLS